MTSDDVVTVGAAQGSLRVGVLVKQVPSVETLTLDDGGRLRRDTAAPEMNAYCRRAVAKGVELVRERGGRCTVMTLGPPEAADVLREAVAWGADDAVLVSDPAFAGSDTLATSRALAEVVRLVGPFDLLLLGRNSVDADTGQVPPGLAELLDWPLLTGVRELRVDGTTAWAHCELDDGWLEATAELPAVLSCAERLCSPCKVAPEVRAKVGPEAIRVVSAADLGPGPWGQRGSPTRVGDVRTVSSDRARRCFDGPVASQVEAAVKELDARGALEADGAAPAAPSVAPSTGGPRRIAVVCDPERLDAGRELLAEAAALAGAVDGTVVALVGSPDVDTEDLGRWGADAVVTTDDTGGCADLASAFAGWCRTVEPWAVLGSSTVWGREVLGRMAAQLGAGLTGDAVGLSVEGGRLVAAKPVFGGGAVAMITASSPVQLATLRPGSLTARRPRAGHRTPSLVRISGSRRERVTRLGSARLDELSVLVRAEAVVGVGLGVAPEAYPSLRPLLEVLGAELAATRKVTDRGWQPRARQIGITGRSISPRLYVAVGVSGKFNHMVGSRGAGTILAVNQDPGAPVFDFCDVGITAPWEEAVPLLVAAVRHLREGDRHGG